MGIRVHIGWERNRPDVPVPDWAATSTLPRSEVSELSLDNKITLLSVYAGQFGSYTTLLWQVPALSLTAQSFLLTIALTHGNNTVSVGLAAGLSIVIALASVQLMHNQRGRAINHAELVNRLSENLHADALLGKLDREDAIPRHTTPQTLWTVDGLIYHVWRWCMYLFIGADAAIIISALGSFHWFN
ncbi:MAG TPA: hypothetical protein VLX31_01410 [Streptosporangiaceae bacterium]|nr:hypothetical protein [Streptosporangiaceae bacterium]